MEHIPDFLLEMSKRINDQGNRMTADPLFEVRYKKSLVTESGYNESHWEIFCENGYTLYHSEKSENYDELADYLFEYESEWCTSFMEEIGEAVDDNVYFSNSDFSEFFGSNFDPELHELPSDIKKLSMQEIEVTVNSHFTEADAQAFIDRKQHDYPKLYIYAISLTCCENMIKLRNWIKELSAPVEN